MAHGQKTGNTPNGVLAYAMQPPTMEGMKAETHRPPAVNNHCEMTGGVVE